MHQLGRAGIPGSNDLETALRRLNLRKQNQEAEDKFAEEERLRLLQGSEPGGTGGSQTPTCPSPGSLWSMDSFGGLPPVGGHGFRSYMPEKLQIVKPMEGEVTMYSEGKKYKTGHHRCEDFFQDSNFEYFSFLKKYFFMAVFF